MVRILSILIIAVVLAACSGDSAPTPPVEPGPYFGSKLSLSGDVYTRNINFDIGNFDPENIDFMSLFNLFTNPSDLITYPEADKNLDLTVFDGDLGGSGKIKDGKFSYSVGEPPADALQLVKADNFSDISIIYKNVSITPQDANAIFLYLTTNDPDFPLLTRENAVAESVPPISLKITAETTSYVYVDKNITISAQGSNVKTTMPIPINDETFMGIPVNLTTHDINLSLKTGWNAIHSIFTVIITPTLTPTSSPPFTIEANGDVNFSVGIPSSHKWVLNSDYNEFLPFP
jgi:hypothetical protein